MWGSKATSFQNHKKMNSYFLRFSLWSFASTTKGNEDTTIKLREEKSIVCYAVEFFQ